MSGTLEKLMTFIASERRGFSNLQNNMFAMGFGQLSRYYEFLSIILQRYQQVSQDFIANTRQLQSLVAAGTHEATKEQLSLHAEGGRIATRLHLEIESFYLFAKILLDKAARMLEFYFGPARSLSLDSHDDLVKRLKKYVNVKKLVLPDGFSDLAHQLKKDISDHRDYQIAHEKSPRTIHGTVYDSEGGTRIASIRFSPKPSERQVETELLDDLLAQIDDYIGPDCCSFLAAIQTRHPRHGQGEK